MNGVAYSFNDGKLGTWGDAPLMTKANLDVYRIMSDCQAAIASTINKYGRIDIVLCCTSQGVPVEPSLISFYSNDSC